MATIKGQNLRIFVGTSLSNLKCVAAAQQCQVHIAAVVGDASDKDSDSDWVQQEITGIQWDVTVEALIKTDADSGAVKPENLTIGQTYKLRFNQTNGSKNRSALTNRLQLTGDAILSDLQFVGGNRQVATYTAKFIGDGDLSQYTT